MNLLAQTQSYDRAGGSRSYEPVPARSMTSFDSFNLRVLIFEKSNTQNKFLGATFEN